MHSNLGQKIKSLKTRWPRLDDVQRVERLSDLLSRNISQRALARELGCSEALIRYTRKVAKLSDETKAQIRAEKSTTRAAVRKPPTSKQKDTVTQSQSLGPAQAAVTRPLPGLNMTA